MKDAELISLFTDMTRVYTAYVERRLLPMGIHTGQGAIISALGECGPCSQKQLAEFRHVSAATVSVMLRRMEKSGLVERSVSGDGKCNLISLTADGLAISEALRKDREGEPERVFAGLSQEELSVAEKIFKTITSNLEDLTTDT